MVYFWLERLGVQLTFQTLAVLACSLLRADAEKKQVVFFRN